MSAVGASGGDGDHELIVAGDGGGGEVAVGPVAIHAAAENMFFATGV